MWGVCVHMCMCMHSHVCMHVHVCICVCAHRKGALSRLGPHAPQGVGDPGEKCSRLEILRGTTPPSPPPSTPNAVFPERHRMLWSQASLASPGPGEHPAHQIKNPGLAASSGGNGHVQTGPGHTGNGPGGGTDWARAGQGARSTETKSQSPRTGSPLGWRRAGLVSPVGCEQKPTTAHPAGGTLG